MVHGQIFHINITTPYPLTGDAPCEPSSVFGLYMDTFRDH